VQQGDDDDRRETKRGDAEASGGDRQTGVVGDEPELTGDTERAGEARGVGRRDEPDGQTERDGREPARDGG
jgi:hypothetical protein